MEGSAAVPAKIFPRRPEVLHDHLSTSMEKAMGKSLPQMEIRVRGLTLTASVRVSDAPEGKTHEVPTLAASATNALQKLVPRPTHKVQRHIIRDFSGVFEPGTMTLVLGQPGSGKSSLLKVLSGRFPHSKTTTMEGDITYNGVTQAELNKRLPQFVSYVPQRDRHFPTLTVRETLAFAHECCGSELSTRDEAHFTQGTPEENKAALEAARAMYRHYPEIVTQQLGLEHCQDTIVGDAMVRGVSGGERKRVTTGEMEFGNKFVTLMDEISTGLDSAATFDIVKTQRSTARKLRKTVVMALLQPSPEVFDLFDSVLILNDGYVMYHGPRDQALGYFESLGFKCPVGRDVADFLMDLGTKQQAQYEVGGSLTQSNCPQSPSEFADAFQVSTIHAEMLTKVHGPHDPALLKDVSTHFDDMPEFHQAFWPSVWTVMKRELKTLSRNGPLLQGRATVLLLMGFIYSTVFFQLDAARIQSATGLLFTIILFMGLNQSAQLPVFMASREIFYKQRGANFYRSSSYVLAVSLCQMPLALAETIVFGSIIYWVCGFVNDVSAFLTFELLLFLTNLAFLAWFFFLSAVSPNMHIGEPFSILSILVFIIFAGFIVTKDNIPDYFIWAYWFNPISWCLRALAINQYRSPELNVCELDGVKYCDDFGVQAGEYLLSVYQIQSDRAWLWYGVAFMVASYVIYMSLTAIVLEYVRYEGPEHVSPETSSTSDDDDTSTADQVDAKSSGDYALATTPRAVAVDVEPPARERHHIPVTLAFKNLRYWVPNPVNPKGEQLELLKGISGFAKPGTITALMGSSGAGKTTLMDVIAGRKTGGRMEGEVLLNGYPATDLAIRRSTGYCEQIDIHSDGSTFREALLFSAFLRQGSNVPDAHKYDTVEEVLDLLDLRPIADQIVHGSSVEQMKRLTIGVELAAQPSVLFLDEPTSGLDARSAKLIMDGVRKVANSGRTVVCTIHQPSSEVFQVFDSLLLLKKGGETVYFGELGHDACELVEYFESIEGVAKLPEGYNPATWMLEVIGAGVDNSAGRDTDFVSIFKSSTKAATLASVMADDGVCCPLEGTPALEFGSKRAATEWTQAKWLLRRALDMQWRTVDYNMSRFLVYLFLALIFGLVFVGSDYTTYQGVNAGVGLILQTSIFVGVTTLESALAMVGHNREVFYRERSSQTYSVFWYFFGVFISEVPYVLSSSFIFCGVLYPLVGFTGLWRFVLYWIHTSLHVLMQMSIGMALSYVFPSVEVAMVIGVLCNSVFFLFMGYNPPADTIPRAYQWLYHITPHQYSFSILTSLIFGECSSDGDEVGCKQVGGTLPPSVEEGTLIKDYVKTVFHADLADVWVSTVFVAGSILFFCLLSLLALRFINHQKR